MSAPTHDAVAESWHLLAERDTVEAAERIWTLWPANRGAFFVFALRPDAETQHRIAPVQDALAASGIGIVMPAGFLHVTVQSVGNANEEGITDTVADGFADEVAASLGRVAPFGVRFAGVGSWGPAAFVGIHETAAARPFAAMQRAVVDAMQEANLAPVRHPERAFLPHLSLCYYDRPYPVAQVAAALAPFRDTDFGTMRVGTIELVRVAGNGEPYPPMAVARAIPLRGE